MKKLITVSLFTLFLFSLFSSQIFANPANESNEHTITLEIDSVYYQPLSNTYQADTFPDSEGGFWTLDLLHIDKPSDQTQNLLEQLYKGSKVSIHYAGDLSDNDNIEIIDFTVLSGE